MVNTRTTNYDEMATDLNQLMKFLQDQKEENERRRQEDKEENLRQRREDKEENLRQRQEAERRRQEDKEEAERRRQEDEEKAEQRQVLLYNRIDEFSGRIDRVEQEIKEQVQLIETKFEEKEKRIEEIEKQIKELNLRQGAVSDRTHNLVAKNEPVIFSTPSTSKDSQRLVQSKMLKPPTFDGQSSWSMYRRQFETVSKANGWNCEEMATSLVISLRGQALEILQSIPEEHQGDYGKIVDALELRYGHQYLRQVYQSQLRTRHQKSEETLQEYEADIERLIHVAYPQAPKEFIEQIGVQVFIDGLIDTEMQQTLRLGRHVTISAALVAALEFKAAKEASRGYRHKVREVKFGETETLKDALDKIVSKLDSLTQRPTETRQDALDKIVSKLDSLTQRPTETRRCYNCGRTGHLQRACRSRTNSRIEGRSSSLGRDMSRSRSPGEGNWRERSPRRRSSPMRVPEQRNRSRSPARGPEKASENLFVHGYLNDLRCKIIIDTGTTRTIVKSGILPKTPKPLLQKIKLETATGEIIPIQGEQEVKIEIGMKTITHEVLVADIKDECILGLDILKENRIVLDIGNRILKVDNEEIILNLGKEEHVRARKIIIEEDIQIPQRSAPILAYPGEDGTFIQDCRYCKKIEDQSTNQESCSQVILTTTVQNNEEWSQEEMIKCQKDDNDLRLVQRWLRNGVRPSWQEVSRHGTTVKGYWAQWDSLCLRDGLVHRKWESPDGVSIVYQLVLPKARIHQVLEELHDSRTGGHFGVKRTLCRVRERYYWVNCRRDVEEWCKRCDVCSGKKGPKTRSRGKMKQYLSGSPFQRVAVDILGPLPVTDTGNKYLMVVMDYFSKWPEIIPIPNQEAVTVAETFIEHVIARHGVPLELHSDQGRNFESELWQGVMKLLGVKKTRTTALHPQSDGMVERHNRTICQYLSAFVSENQRDWDKLIPLFLLSYRSSQHEATGYTPSMLVQGREMKLPTDIIFGHPPDGDRPDQSLPEFVGNLQYRMERVHEFARDRLKMQSDKMKQRLDNKTTDLDFKEGDAVWLYAPKRTKGRSPKLQRNWEGPYRVIKKINDLVYRIQLSPRSKPKVVHLERLSKYRGHDPPGWCLDEGASESCSFVRDEQV